MQLPQPVERVNVIFGHVCRVTSSQQRERIQVGLSVSFITVLCVCVRTHTHGWAWTDSPKRWYTKASWAGLGPCVWMGLADFPPLKRRLC